jgi:hypothetical protein
MLTERESVLGMYDKAHRSKYGLVARTNAESSYSYA